MRLDRYGDPGHREKLAGLFFSPPWTRPPKGYEPKGLLGERYQEERRLEVCCQLWKELTRRHRNRKLPPELRVLSPGVSTGTYSYRRDHCGVEYEKSTLKRDVTGVITS